MTRPAIDTPALFDAMPVEAVAAMGRAAEHVATHSDLFGYALASAVYFGAAVLIAFIFQRWC